MNNYQPSPLSKQQQQQNNYSPTSTQQPNPNAAGYPIYIQNPTYSHNGSSSSNSHSLSGGSSSMDSGETTPHASMENMHLPPPPAYLVGQNGEKVKVGGSGSSSGSTTSAEDAKRTASVAETIKNLTEKNHHPVSPHMVRRAQSLRTEEHHIPIKEKEVRSTPNSRRGSCNNAENNHTAVSPPTNNNQKITRTNLIQTLNQKLTYGNTTGVPPMGPASTNNGGQNIANNYNHGPPAIQHQPLYQQLTSHQQHQLHQQYSQSQPIYSQVYQQSQSSQPIYQQILPNNGTGQVQYQQGDNMCNSNNTSRGRTPRRFSEELIKTTATLVKNSVIGSKTPPIVTSKEIFVQTLNAKLSQMRQSPPTDRKNSHPSYPQNSQSPHSQQHQQPPPNPKPTSFASKLVASVHSHQRGHGGSEISRALRVRQWISSKTVPDPNACRDSLMEQVRRGTKLKPTRTVNDRSAPKIYHQR